jgi:polysaccharide deacetylase 2 family uncharacterized protein YibQ
VAKKPKTEAIPDIVADAPEKRRGGGFFSRLAERFRRKKDADAFGKAEEPEDAPDAFGKTEEKAAPEDPFGVGDAEQDARFRRKRRLMAVAMLLLLLGGGGGAAAYIWLAPKPTPKPQPEGSGRVLQTMPPETGPENLANALIRPPAATDNPDALRRMGSLTPDDAAKLPGPAQAPAQPAPAEPQAAAPQTPADPPPAAIPPPDEPLSPAPRSDRDKASRAPRFADIAKPATPPPPLPKGAVSDLQQRTTAGLTVPATAKDGRRPWQTYARPFSAQSGMPRIALVIRGLGLASEPTNAAIDLLPPEVTLAFDAHAVQLPERLAAARRGGHEALLEIGLESASFPAVDPGPDGLISSLPVEENSLRLERALSHGDVYVGVLATGGDRYAASAPHFAAFAQAMSRMGLATVAAPQAVRFESAGVRAPRVPIDLHIDDNAFREQIESRLRQAETLARKRGAAVIVADATPLTLSMLTSWMASMPGKALQPAPISAVVKE